MDRSAVAEVESRIAQHLPTVRSVLVAQRGELSYERYFEGASEQERVPIFSCTKSIVSILVGILVRQHRFPGLDEKVADLLPSLAARAHPSFRTITLRQCLNMTIGYRPEVGDYDVRAAIADPVVDEPGTAFYYNDIGPQIIGMLVASRSGSSLSAFANEVLFRPLGIERPYWREAEDGHDVAGWGLELTPREMMRFGEFTLKECLGTGLGVVDEAFFADARSTQSDGGFPGLNPYGYLWWVSARGDARSYYALGIDGQLIAICPERRLVVVATCSRGLGPRIGPIQDLYFDLLMPASARM